MNFVWKTILLFLIKSPKNIQYNRVYMLLSRAWKTYVLAAFFASVLPAVKHLSPMENQDITNG
jgi:hypothetical protein